MPRGRGRGSAKGNRFFRRDFHGNRPNVWKRKRGDHGGGGEGNRGEGNEGGQGGDGWQPFVLKNEAFESYYKVLNACNVQSLSLLDINAGLDDAVQPLKPV